MRVKGTPFYLMAVAGTLGGLCGSSTKAEARYSASTNLSPIDGMCGSADGVASASKPASNLCADGRASRVVGNKRNGWMWACRGSDGGVNAYCSASSGSAALPADNFKVKAPANGAVVSGTVQITGMTGSHWVNVRAFANGAPVTLDNAPQNGSYILSLDTTKLPNGPITISIDAFSVPAGDPAGIPGVVKTIILNLVIHNTTVAPAPTPSPAPTPTPAPTPAPTPPMV